MSELQRLAKLQRHLIAAVADRARPHDFAQVRGRARAVQRNAAGLADRKPLAQQERQAAEARIAREDFVGAVGVQPIQHRERRLGLDGSAVIIPTVGIRQRHHRRPPPRTHLAVAGPHHRGGGRRREGGSRSRGIAEANGVHP